MNDITKKLLGKISDFAGSFTGAFSIRENGCSVAMQSDKNVSIKAKKDAPGLDIVVVPGAKDERISIPACVTHGDIDDLVYNDFYIGENAEDTIIAGCGVHTETGEPARHNGIHAFHLEKGAKVKYIEKHIGTGKGTGIRTIDPVTQVFLAENAVLEMETAQIGGVDKSLRKTSAELAAGARLVVKESILTEGTQSASTDFDVVLNGENSGVDIISRAVAKDSSHQDYVSVITGKAPCTGHSECDAIVDGNATVDAAPKLCAHHADAQLIHEAAIGKIAGDQILKLRTFGLTEQEAEAKIIEGFLGETI